MSRDDIVRAGAALGDDSRVPEVFDDCTLHVGLQDGSATWSQETDSIDGKAHGVNRGYLTSSRFHATDSSSSGSGFGWRRVLALTP